MGRYQFVALAVLGISVVALSGFSVLARVDTTLDRLATANNQLITANAHLGIANQQLSEMKSQLSEVSQQLVATNRRLDETQANVAKVSTKIDKTNEGLALTLAQLGETKKPRLHKRMESWGCSTKYSRSSRYLVGGPFRNLEGRAQIV